MSRLSSCLHKKLVEPRFLRSLLPTGFLSGLLGVLICLAGAGGQGAEPDTATVQVVAADTRQVVVDLVIPRYDLHRLVVAGIEYTAISVPGLDATTGPGDPQLPGAATLVGVPPGATLTLRVLSADAMTVPLAAPILPGAYPVFADAPLAMLPSRSDAVYAPNQAVYGADAWFPSALATAGAPVQWRSQRVVAVQLHPVQMNPVQRTLRIYHHLRIAIEFNDTGLSPAAARTAVDEGPFERVLAATLINYQPARAWRTPVASPQSRAQVATTPWLRVVTGETGIYALPCPLLAAAGLDLANVDVTTLQLFRHGQTGEEIALDVRDANGDGRCDATTGAKILFYAEASTAPSSVTRVYWLTYGHRAGKRMRMDAGANPTATPVTTYLHSTRLEQNRLYYSYIPLQEGADHWYWDVLSPYTGTSRSYTVTVDHLSPGGAPGRLDIALAGYDGGHRTQLFVNDRLVEDTAWQGRTAYTATVALPDGLLQEGANTLRVAATGGASDYQYVNAFAFSYARSFYAMEDGLRFDQPSGGAWRYTLAGFTAAEVAVYDISAPADVHQIATIANASPCPCTVDFTTPAAGPRTYLSLTASQMRTPLSLDLALPSDLLAPAQGADYLIITPAMWTAQVEPLAQLHAGEGLRVRVVDLQMVYDTFGDGSADPASLRAFLAYALANWPAPAPTYVLLVGDGSYDPRGYVTAAGQNPMPAYLRLVDPWLGETASDNQLVAFDPATNLPALAIGRLPAVTTGDLDAIVAKIVGYAQATPAPRRLAVVAGAAYTAGGTPDPAGNFWQFGDQVAASAAPSLAVTRLYYNPCPATTNPACALPDPPYPAYPSGPALTSALVDAINAGQTLVAYTGHGAPGSWGGNPTLFGVGDVSRLNNGDHLPVTLDLTCYTGYFQMPQRVTLAEALLRQAGSGAVGAWASSGQGVASGHLWLARGFLTAWLDQGIDRVGLAALAGKAALWANAGGVHTELIDTYHFFGDPALRLPPSAMPPVTPTPVLTPAAPTSTPPPGPTATPPATLFLPHLCAPPPSPSLPSPPPPP